MYADSIVVKSRDHRAICIEHVIGSANCLVTDRCEEISSKVVLDSRNGLPAERCRTAVLRIKVILLSSCSYPSCRHPTKRVEHIHAAGYRLKAHYSLVVVVVICVAAADIKSCLFDD